jgi:hypothetical protein
MQNLHKIYNAPAFWMASNARTKVKPFPGKFPTRWRIACYKGEEKMFELTTKPDQKAIDRVARLCKQGWEMVAAEFDLGGAFRCARVANSKKTPLVVRYWSPAVAYFYYPWSITSAEFFGPWRTPLFHKEICIGRRKFFIFSPNQHQMAGEANIERVREYKNWLNKTKPWK